MRKPLVLLGVPVAIVAAVIVSWRALPDLDASPRTLRARDSVTDILFLQDRTVVRNELAELFASDDQGRSWHSLSAEPTALAVAEGNQLWGAHGWKGHHEAPSAKIWRSTDRGERWTQRKIDLPERHSSELHDRLPALFLNEPSAPPLLLMANFQLVRPDPGADFSSWAKVGTPVPGLTPLKGTINHYTAGLQYQRSIYIAASNQIFFSGDAGASWSSQIVDLFSQGRIRCRGTACYALLSPSGSQPATLLTTEAGGSDWKKMVQLDHVAVAPALLAGQPNMSIEAFSANDMVVTADGILVAGSVNAGPSSWGAVLRVDRDGSITRLGQGVPVGLWVLEQAPDGTLWAGGGKGAYRLQGDQWVKAWSSTK